MTGMQWDTSEVAALEASFDRAGSEVGPKAQRVIAKAAHDVEAQAKTRAPVDTGYLRSSISADIRGLTAIVGPTAHYGGYVERGTSRMAAQPYMAPAADAVTPGFAAAMEQLGGEVLS